MVQFSAIVHLLVVFVLRFEFGQPMLKQALFRMLPDCGMNHLYNFLNPIGTLDVLSNSMCVSYCASQPMCHSVNIIRQNQGVRCELGEDIVRTCSGLTYLAGAKFMYLDESMPECQNGGVWDESVQRCLGCDAYFMGQFCERYPYDCSEISIGGWGWTGNGMGFKTIKPAASVTPFEVYCMLGYGGWTFLELRRININPPLDFNRSWAEYKDGFGNIRAASPGDYFIGLQKMSEITARGPFLLSIVGTNDNHQRYYKNFRIENEEKGFAIHYGDSYPHGSYPLANGFDDGTHLCPGSINGSHFCTYDNDCGGCAMATGSGWWFGENCTGVNLHTPSIVGSHVAEWPDYYTPNTIYKLTQMRFMVKFG